jgi:hypothetical protein
MIGCAVEPVRTASYTHGGNRRNQGITWRSPGAFADPVDNPEPDHLCRRARSGNQWPNQDGDAVP